MDWNQLRAFLAVVDAGSMTAAARVLATSQPTVSRLISELEVATGVALFERVARGLRLTRAGDALVRPVRQMQKAAESASLAAMESSQRLEGSVRVSASEMVSAYVLPPIFKKLRQTHPSIELELSVSNRVENLLERQADIAIRHARPSQGGLLAKRVAQWKVGAFAHTDYLELVGGHVDLARAADYDWLGLDSADTLLRGFQAAGLPVERNFFVFRSDSWVAGWQSALAGVGIGFAPTIVADLWPSMHAVLPEKMVLKLPVWITAHRELRQTPRIRVVFDALVADLGAA